MNEDFINISPEIAGRLTTKKRTIKNAHAATVPRIAAFKIKI